MKVKTQSKKVNKAWLNDHVNDTYVKLAQKEGYRARAAYKLKEIDEQLGLIKPGYTVVDLGSTPGAWSQYLRRRLSPTGAAAGQLNGVIIALDWHANPGTGSPLLTEALRQLQAYFDRRLTRFDLPLEFGSGFQAQVRHAMAAIPYGETRRYGDLARDMFIQGKLALFQSGPYSLPAIAEGATDINWGIVPMIAGPVASTGTKKRSFHEMISLKRP